MSEPTREGSPDLAAFDRKAHLRPRFELTTPLDVGTVLDRVRALIARNDDVLGIALDSGRIELTLNEESIRFWSPQLTIDAEARGDESEDAEGGTRLLARFGPHPHVWTLYLALYATSVALAIGCVMFGISQWIVGSEPWGLYLSPLAVVLSALVYGASYVGQGLGALQMQELRGLVERALASDEPDLTARSLPAADPSRS